MEEVYTFGGNPLDRASERRGDAGWIDGLLADPATRLLVMHDLRPAMAAGPAIDWQPAAPWRDAIAAGAPLVFLGLDDGRARFALDATRHVAPPAAELADVRSLAPRVPAAEAAILAEARAIVDWHARHGFCAVCGSPSRMTTAGWQRRCPSCGASHFPRTDPVVIMLAIDGERCLLGRNKRPGARFSCLAGFVEPGETLEEAVRRETFEEAGIRLARVRYVASQPWPFPSSLMMGFHAEAASTAVTVDPDELAEARWFDRAAVRRMVVEAAAGTPGPEAIPAPIAIGHQLIRLWAEGQSAL